MTTKAATQWLMGEQCEQCVQRGKAGQRGPTAWVGCSREARDLKCGVFRSGILHLISLGCSWPQVTETMKSKTTGKGVTVMPLICFSVHLCVKYSLFTCSACVVF